MKQIDFQTPIRTVSEANMREHYMAKHRRKKEQQFMMMLALQNNLIGRKIQFPCVVKLTRIGPRKLDSDNLAGSLKHVQDIVAKTLGVDDGDEEKIRWEYKQAPHGFNGEYAVRVVIISG
jgi:hypothetical protein